MFLIKDKEIRIFLFSVFYCSSSGCDMSLRVTRTDSPDIFFNHYMNHSFAMMTGCIKHGAKFCVIEKLDVMTQKVLSFSLVRDLEVWE